MPFAKNEVVEVQSSYDTPWVTAMITGPLEDHGPTSSSLGLVWHPIWTTDGHSTRPLHYIRAFTGTDIAKNVFMDAYAAANPHSGGRYRKSRKQKKQKKQKQKQTRSIRRRKSLKRVAY
jgi:hypothetical protein